MPKFDIVRRIDFDNLKHEFQLDGARLLPWAGYSMPFAGGWCVVRPGTESEPHTQIDQEIFIGIHGEAVLVVGDETWPFRMGDIAAIPKRTNHYFRNTSNDDFHFYVIWWDMNYVNAFMTNHDDRTGCLDG